MVVDQLSEIFDLVKVQGLVSGGFASRGPWVARGPMMDPVKLIAMVSGRSRLRTDGITEPVELEPGDVAIVNNQSRLEHEGKGGIGDGPPQMITPQPNFDRLVGADRDTDDIVLGIAVDLNATGRELLQQALPPVAHVRASTTTAANLRPTLERLFDEVAGSRMGSAFAIRQYGQLVLLEVLRAYVDQAELPQGWLRLLTDERLRPAVGRMHAEPGKPWGLAELAHTAAMSRTSFAERFRTVAGVPPMTYLNRWRILLAQQALREGDVRVGTLAVELGYASESAFSTAFKREVGESPLRYRHRKRADSAPV